MEDAIATARKAVDSTEHIETVSCQLAQLFTYVTEPLDAGQDPLAGR